MIVTSPSRVARIALRAAQIIGALAMLAAAALVAVNLPYRFEQLSTVCTASPCLAGQLQPAEGALLAQWGIGPGVYGGYVIGLYLLYALVSVGIAGLLLWRRANDTTAVLAAIVLVTQAGAATLGDAALRPGWDSVLTLLLLVWYVALVNLLYLFPDGRFVPRWSRWAFAPWVGWLVLGFAYVIATLTEPPTWYWAGVFGLTFALFLLGGAAQIYRYRAVSNQAQRQQTKWVVAGFTVYIAAEVLFTAYNGLQTAGGLGYELISSVLDVATLLAVPLSLGAAIFRYRLWEIDVVIRRTLVYSTLTALLAATYFLSVVVLQNTAAFITGERQAAWVTVLSTLLIAALFAPVRLRVQRFIDRRFFRRRYDAARALAAFGETLKDDVNLDELRADLLAAVQESMEPETVSLWVRPG